MFVSVKSSLRSLLGDSYIDQVIKASCFLHGFSLAQAEAIATEEVEFFPAGFEKSLEALLPRILADIVLEHHGAGWRRLHKIRDGCRCRIAQRIADRIEIHVVHEGNRRLVDGMRRFRRFRRLTVLRHITQRLGHDARRRMLHERTFQVVPHRLLRP